MDVAPTERETQILKVLWDLEEAPVREVHAALEAEGLHFNTVQTQLRIMDEKGLVAHRREGRTFVYRPLCSREDVSKRFLHKVFDGAVGDLVLSMVSAEKLSTDELRDLEKLIAKSRRGTASAPKAKSPKRKPRGGKS